MKSAALNTTPLVGPDGSGGHEPFFRIDVSPLYDGPTLPQSGLGPANPVATADLALYHKVDQLVELAQSVLDILVAMHDP